MFYLERLMIKSFRNYEEQEIAFSPNLNIIEGHNAQGKTNLLEAIYYLTVNRSFRTSHDQEMINYNANYFRVKGHFRNNEFNNEIDILYRHKESLLIKLNREQVNRYDFLQKFPVVVFGPDDLSIIKDGPSVRRRFLNLESSRLNKIYFEQLKDYQRVLKQRNFILKNSYSGKCINDQLNPWSDSLIELGSSIMQARQEIVRDIQDEAQKFFRVLTDNEENLDMEYVGTFLLPDTVSATRDLFRKKIAEKRELEFRRGTTMVGPHLDDLKILINGFDTRKYSSQGQKRTAALALKMAEINLFKKKNTLWPIILLDDVFSEFDRKRREYLLDFIRESSGQCFISTADSIDNLVKNIDIEYKKIHINKGRIKSETDRPFN